MKIEPPSRTASSRVAGDLDDGPARQRFELLAQPRHTGTQVAELAGTAFQANGRSTGPATRTHELALVILRDGGVAGLTTSELATRRARQQTRSALAIQHAHHPCVRAQHSSERVREQRRTRRLVTPVDDLAARATRARSSSRGSVTSSTQLQRLERGRRRDQRARHIGPPGAFDHDVARVPGGRRLLLPHLVVLVDEQDRTQVGHGRPMPPNACPRRSTPCEPPPTRRDTAQPMPVAAQLVDQSLGGEERRHEDQGARSSAVDDAVVGRGARAAGAARVVLRALAPEPRNVASSEAGHVALAVTRCAGSERARQPIATPPSRPAR